MIPPKTAEKLATVFPEGTRHKAAMDIAMPLIGNGLPDSAVFATLREKFPADMKDSELKSIVSWCRGRAKPCSGNGGNGNGRYHPPSSPPQAIKPKRTHVEQAEWWCSGARLTPDQIKAQSPIAIPDKPSDYAVLALSSLYRADDHLNLVCKFIQDDDKKARPHGSGATLSRDHWITRIKEKGVPEKEAGTWFRLNPCSPTGTGTAGAMTDADIMRFEYVLVESDKLPVGLQLALLRRWKLPVAAIVLSGGESAHAWVRVRSATSEEFRSIVGKLFETLEPFGFDQANRNPSRLCRFPGAVRKIGAVDGGEQRLVWLNPDVSPLTPEGLDAFSQTLQFPYSDGKPLRALALEAIDRYEDMVRNRGKLGVPTGIPALDEISGGWKPGQTTVVCGETGGGKTTFALHCIVAALESGCGVLLFSLEMDRAEIFDLLVSNFAEVNRNAFNTGSFLERDLSRISTAMPKIMNLPLYIEDGSILTADQIKARVFQLKSDNQIGLVVVDYIQFVSPGLTRDNREQQVAGISQSLRSIARESNLPMIVLSQLNEEGKLRESRVISHNANIVIKVEVEGNNFRAIVVKGRGIPCGQYDLEFDRQYARLIPQTPTRRQGEGIP